MAARDSETQPPDSDYPSPTPSEFEVFNEIVRDTLHDTLPALPPPANSCQLPPLSAVCRKRTRDQLYADSSDPPAFSSDDLPESSENYFTRRTKRHYHGTWWGDKIEDFTQHGKNELTRPRKREFQRKMDSACWMASDDLASDEDGEVDEEASFRSDVNAAEKNEDVERNDVSPSLFGCRSTEEYPYGQQQPADLARSHAAQMHAAEVVRQCVEECQETVDLSGCELGEILGSTLKPLHYLTKQPSDDLPSSQDHYTPLTPSLQIFLSGNNLRQIPSEIYTLQNLTVLSLRYNRLAGILPSISHLTDLKELNLGCNSLSWLPWELLSLCHNNLNRISIHPNPFLQPIPPVLSNSDNTTTSTATTDPKPDTQISRHSACSVISYLSVDGTPLRGSPPAPPSLITHDPTSTPRSPLPPQPHPTLTPSLFELTLSACTRSRLLLPHLPSLLSPSSDIPPTVRSALHHALQVRSAGGQACSVCKRDYLVPRTEWIEWRDIMPAVGSSPNGPKGPHAQIPLLRRGCSWACAVSEQERKQFSLSACGWVMPVEKDQSREEVVMETVGAGGGRAQDVEVVVATEAV